MSKNLTSTELAALNVQIQKARSISDILRIAHHVQISRVACGYRVHATAVPAYSEQELEWFRRPVK